MLINKEELRNKELFFTKDHEWIEFQNQVAYTGICSFKLTGFKEIQEVIFNDPFAPKKQGDVIATILYNDYKIQAHMPIDGNIVEINDKLLSENNNLLLQYAETNGWIAMIIPLFPINRQELIPAEIYYLKNKYPKNPKTQ